MSPSTDPPAGGVPEGPAEGPVRPPRAVLPALCVTQVTCWGILYYAFPVLRADLVADTGWSSTRVTAAYSAALVVSAVAGLAVGRSIDHRGPRHLMSAGGVVGVVGLATAAAAPGLVVFTVGWLVAGLAMAATFYHPAFAALTRWHRGEQVRALTVLTLAGGLASTVFAPLTDALTQTLGWRGALAVLATVLLTVATPLHWFALAAPWPGHEDRGPGRDPGAGVPGSRSFVLLTVAMALSGFALYGALFGLIPLLLERGASATTAAWALGLGGAGQTLGRLLYAPLSARTGPGVRLVAILIAAAIAIALLAVVPGPVTLLVALAVLAGTVRGNHTLVQATAVSDRYGTAAYGRLSAALALPVTIAGALSPWAVAAAATRVGGHTAVFLGLAALALLAAALARRISSVDTPKEQART
ncbi:MAG: MFS transporter [Micrococcales bacterium]|nr:MFS transporter [Micrococcales bacterium]